jgi:hypothetical protein
MTDVVRAADKPVETPDLMGDENSSGGGSAVGDGGEVGTLVGESAGGRMAALRSMVLRGVLVEYGRCGVGLSLSLSERGCSLGRRGIVSAHARGVLGISLVGVAVDGVRVDRVEGDEDEVVCFLGAGFLRKKSSTRLSSSIFKSVYCCTILFKI